MKFLSSCVWALALLAPHLALAGGNGAMHKCVQGQTVVYMDKPCPTGQQAQAMTGGSVSTTEAQPSARPDDSGYYYYYRSTSGKPQVPYLSKQKSVDEALKERSIRR
jgi:hypothetical protein